MTRTAHGTFDVEFPTTGSELDGTVQRLEFAKTFHGDLNAAGRGILLSGGDPQAGSAGYVAIETITGQLDGLAGEFAMQQFGTMHNGARTLHYEVVPGSGTGELEGITGLLHLTIEDDGTHRYELDYTLRDGTVRAS